MKTPVHSLRDLVATIAGGALLLALASLQTASAQTNTTNGPNATLTNGITAGAALTAGSNNTALGEGAGLSLTTGDFNIDIANLGVAGESGTIRIGVQDTQTATCIAGVWGPNVGAGGLPVYVNSAGQLGTNAVSSRRFKRDIADVGAASDVLLSMRPVTFRFKPELEARGSPQFGLIAEEIEELNPDLVVRDAKGEIFSVRYDAINAMLLNEFLKEHRRVEAQAKTMESQANAIAEKNASRRWKGPAAPWSSASPCSRAKVRKVALQP